MSAIKTLSKTVRSYCEKTSLVGFSYVCNEKIHLSERIIWFVCIILSAGGSYYLIREYDRDFKRHTISLVAEDARPKDTMEFPTVALCEAGDLRFSRYPRLSEFIEKLGTPNSPNAKNDVEDYLLGVVFPHQYIAKRFKLNCQAYINCTNCVKCPTTGYKEIGDLIRRDCAELITECSWNGMPFNCCNYFLPMMTPSGYCFMLNSLYTTKKNSPHWLKTDFILTDDDAILQVEIKHPVELFVINAEDVPTRLVHSNSFLAKTRLDVVQQITVQPMVNDADVSHTPPQYRRCRFPEETLDNSSYNYYSFSTCISDCIKQMQLQTCGCTFLTYLGNSEGPLCDYYGNVCLDQADLVQPPPSVLQPWNPKGLKCQCFPSCTEHEIAVFEKFFRIGSHPGRRFIIKQFGNVNQFRRQVVRTKLDVVVTIGGILGLFLGASLLSAMEIFYFFFVRILAPQG